MEEERKLKKLGESPCKQDKDSDTMRNLLGVKEKIVWKASNMV